MNYFFATKFYNYFSENPANVISNGIFPVQKTLQKNDENYAFWVALRTIHISRLGFHTGAQNHAKWRQNASQISAKWPWKNTYPDVAMLKNARRRPSCEPAWKRVHFCRSRVALLKQRIFKSSKVIENLSQMPAARRANSECILSKNYKKHKIW